MGREPLFKWLGPAKTKLTLSGKSGMVLQIESLATELVATWRENRSAALLEFVTGLETSFTAMPEFLADSFAQLNTIYEQSEFRKDAQMFAQRARRWKENPRGAAAAAAAAVAARSASPKPKPKPSSASSSSSTSKASSEANASSSASANSSAPAAKTPGAPTPAAVPVPVPVPAPVPVPSEPELPVIKVGYPIRLGDLPVSDHIKNWLDESGISRYKLRSSQQNPQNDGRTFVEVSVIARDSERIFALIKPRLERLGLGVGSYLISPTGQRTSL
jgi:hypothetical protein